jgi:hypothetical protein
MRHVVVHSKCWRIETVVNTGVGLGGRNCYFAVVHFVQVCAAPSWFEHQRNRA